MPPIHPYIKKPISNATIDRIPIISISAIYYDIFDILTLKVRKCDSENELQTVTVYYSCAYKLVKPDEQ